MPEITNIKTSEGNFLFVGLAATDTTSPIKINGTAGLTGVLQAVSGGGSGFNGGSITLQGSLDYVNWFDLPNLAGDPAVLSAAGLMEFATGVCYIRAIAGAGVADVDVTLRVAR